MCRTSSSYIKNTTPATTTSNEVATSPLTQFKIIVPSQNVKTHLVNHVITPMQIPNTKWISNFNESSLSSMYCILHHMLNDLTNVLHIIYTYSYNEMHF